MVYVHQPRHTGARDALCSYVTWLLGLPVIKDFIIKSFIIILWYHAIYVVCPTKMSFCGTWLYALEISTHLRKSVFMGIGVSHLKWNQFQQWYQYYPHCVLAAVWPCVTGTAKGTCVTFHSIAVPLPASGSPDLKLLPQARAVKILCRGSARSFIF